MASSSTSNQPENDEDQFWEDIMNFVDNYEQEIDQEMGRHIVGNLVNIPKLNSLVYYFPQGHMENVQQDVLHPVDYGSFLCRVANVSFYAGLQTDQVFVKFLLEPWITDDNSNPNPNPNPNPSPIQMGGNDNNDIVSFVKVLSKSNVSMNRLFVTNAFRECIFSQFPTSIKQYISVNDIHGKIWKIMFQSLGSSSPSTWLTCGWYDFVKTKNLRAGDSIVFMLKKSTNEYFVGIRRAVLNKPISVKDLEDAIEKVRNMMSFEVVYYPNLGLPEFIVPKEKVDAALHVQWRRNMPVKIAYVDFGCSNEPVKHWFYGYLLNDVNLETDGFSPNSSWRMLQVQWNERPDILMNMPNMSNMQMKMSPWEVEVLQPSYNEREIDEEMGRHIVGNLVDIPKLNSLVYYFPQGHMEYVQEDVLHPVDYGSFLCRVANVSFYADSQTDQVFVKFLLEPWITNDNSNPNPNLNPNPNPNPSPIQMGGNDNNDIVSFVKVLSKSDVSNVNNLVVTNAFRDCIFSQFPRSIKQYILVNDIHGKIWKIMFQSLGSSSGSTTLTNGWYDFVKTKNLRAGDSIVFMLKKSTNEYFVGIRRAVLNKSISVKDVEDAIEKVRNMMSFEVVYYPNMGLPEFVVHKEKVDAALHVHWRHKMSVKIAYEDFRYSPPVKSWLNGYILKDVNPEMDGFSPNSSWRMLQVQWNVRPDILKNMPNIQMNMSPWEVEVLQPS